MQGWQFQWFEPSHYWETLTEHIETPANVVARLDELERRFWFGEKLCVAPALCAPDAGRLLVGLAGMHWLLTHIGTGDCEFSWAIGNPQATGTIWVHYPADTEVSRKQLVRRTDAVRAVVEWLELGALGGGLTWTDDYRVAS